MTYPKISAKLLAGVAIILSSLPAQGFWFLPNFGAPDLTEARQRTFAAGSESSESIAVIPQEAIIPNGQTDLAVIPEVATNASADFVEPSLEILTFDESTLFVESSLPSIIENEGDHSPLDSSSGIVSSRIVSLDITPDITPAQETGIEEQAVQAVVAATIPLPSQGIDLDLEMVVNAGGAPTPINTSQPLSFHELDRILPSDSFNIYYDLSDGQAQQALNTFPISIFLEVESGDTLSSLFESAGISIVETQTAGRALGEVFNLGSLRPGQIIELELDGTVEPFGKNRLKRLSLSPTSLEVIEVVRNGRQFESKVSKIELQKVLIHATGPLETGSIYADGSSLDIDGSMIANFVNALDAQVNFSRIQSAGDEIEMIYEAYFGEDGKLVDAGNVLYASFRDQNGKTYEAFRFDTNGKAAYFTRGARFTGQTNTLMRKPLGGGRLTSPFGLRTHPVYGDRRMHNGVDYGAACGTPIYAAGNGVISFSGWKGGYGRFISVKHGSTYSTNYAHMRSFANGMRPGARVRKGQLIGRVGTTGVSTGCHLHYEVVKNGKRINPLSSHIPRGSDLTSGAKTRFSAFVEQLDAERTNSLSIDQALAKARLGVF